MVIWWTTICCVIEKYTKRQFSIKGLCVGVEDEEAKVH